MAVLHLSMAQDRRRRFRFALTFAACSVPCLLSGCVTYHSAGQPYSGTAFWLENAAKPWHCYDTAPNKTLAFAVGVPYTAVVVSGCHDRDQQTLILPVDHYFGGPDLPDARTRLMQHVLGSARAPVAPPSEQPP